MRDPKKYLNDTTESDIINLYRLDKHGIQYFADRIRNHPDVAKSTKAGLSSETQVLVALRYYATGNSVISLKNTADLKLSHGSVFNAIKNVSSALCSLLREDVAYSFEESEISEIQQGFFEYGGFPCCMGAIDGTMIKIKAPPIREDVYVGRKTDGHYLNVQFVCDVKLRFLDAVIKYPGSVTDKTIWSMCGLNEKLGGFLTSQERCYRGYFIGDSGYNQRAKMMIPLLDPVGKKELSYNKAHKKCRCCVERSIGVYKSRFRCLCKQSGGGIQFDVEIACTIIGACAVLHNYCRVRNIPFEVATDVAADIAADIAVDVAVDIAHPDIDDVSDEDRYNDDVATGYRARQEIIDAYFA